MSKHQYKQKKFSIGIQHRLIKSRGDTLIEILITFFVIAVGVLGASSMQIVALQNVNRSSNRDQAVIITENLSEEIRARAAASPNPVLLTNDPGTLIANYAALAGNLPSGRLGVTADGNINLPFTTDDAPITITVRWDEDRDGDIGVACPVLSSDDLDCHQISFSP